MEITAPCVYFFAEIGTEFTIGLDKKDHIYLGVILFRRMYISKSQTANEQRFRKKNQKRSHLFRGNPFSSHVYIKVKENKTEYDL